MRFGIIGAGTMARVHAESLSRIAGTQVIGFSAHELPVPEATQALAGQLGATIVLEADELLVRSDVDALVIAAPTDVHPGLVSAAAQAGKHVVCEKPLARTLADCEAMLRAVEQAGVKLAVGQVVRYFPDYAGVRDMVVRGELGRPGVARAARGAGFPAAPSNWYADLARSGGVVLDMMIHDFDWMLWSFGPLERIHAKAITGRVAGKDMAMATLRFRSGALGYVEGSWAYPGGFRTSLEVSGSEGLVRTASRPTTPLSFELAPSAAAGGVAVPTGGLVEDPYTIQMRDFVRWFAGGPEPRCTGSDAMEAVRISLAALDSIRSNRPIRLAEFA